jgi:SAM-dependent methyltransferase
MNTAFGQAMIDSIRGGSPRNFTMSPVGQGGMNMPCSAFLTTRSDENLLLASLDLPENGSVLDYGCGAGRHLSKLREGRSRLQLYGVEICDLLRNHCQQMFGLASTFVESLGDLPAKEFDLIMLMGNGLGVLGSEQNAIAQLEVLVGILGSGGRILIEAGNPFSTGYSARDFIISYDGAQDDPFTWGYADQQWVRKTLEQLGCTATIQPSQAPLPGSFFAIGTKA